MQGWPGLRVTLRSLARSRGFVAAGAGTLGLGIAATTTIFSVVYGVVLRPLPYADPPALVVIAGEKDFSTGPRIMNFSAPKIEEFAGATTAFASIASSAATGYTVRNESGVESTSAAIVSGDFFRTMATPPLVGRWLADEAEPGAVISERLWRQRFGGADDVLGQGLTLTDREFVSRTFTIIGVMPHAFQYPHARTDVWRPLRYERSTGDKQILNRNAGGHVFVARLRPGVDLQEARRDAERANGVLRPTYTGGRAGMRATVTPLSDHVTGRGQARARRHPPAARRACDDRERHHRRARRRDRRGGLVRRGGGEPDRGGAGRQLPAGPASRAHRPRHCPPRGIVCAFCGPLRLGPHS